MSLDRRAFLAAMSAAPLLPNSRAAAATAPTLTYLLAQSGVPALGYAVVDATGMKAIDVAGLRRANAAERATRDDLWHIGSNTKAMTAALYAKLVEQGRAQWGVKVPALFHDLPVEPGWTNTTIEDLLAHRSGVSDKGLIDQAWLARAHADKRPVAEQRTDFARSLLARAATGTPGSFEYANANYMLAGAAIERIAGADWETAIATELFKPLAMQTAGFGAPQGAEPWGHAPGPNNGFLPVDPAGLADNPAVMGPAGRVHLSLADYASFARLFLTDGGGYLRPESLMRLARPWGSATEGYALGWQTYPERAWARGPVLAHEGSNTLWHATAIIGPARPLAVLTVSNAGARGGAATQQLALSLIQSYAGQG